MRLTDLHWLVNHFSFGLILIGCISEYHGFLTGNIGSRRFGWSALRIGLAFYVLSLLTGFLTQSKTFIDPSAHTVVNYHLVTALITSATLGAALVLRSFARDRFDHKEQGASIRGAYIAITAITLVLNVMTGYLGMQLVYTHGVNVAPYEELLRSLPSNAVPIAPDSAQPAQ